jgi:nicotinate-nucleotide adenylyltransferase
VALLNKRLGILGGSFNPVHFAHLAMAQEAWYRLELASVLLVPVARNPLREGPPEGATDEQRLAMLRLVCHEDSRFIVDASEVRQGGTSYTIETLKRLKSRNPDAELYLLIGADSALSLPRWKDIREFGELCAIVVCNRPGEADLSAGFPQELLDLELRLEYMPLPPLAISSSEIRRRIRLGKPVRYFVPDAVAEYIHEQQLYLGL